MIIWKILELSSEAKSVKFLASITDGTNTVEQEGNYLFPEGVVNLPFEQIKEQNLIDWIDKEAVESNLTAQLQAMDSDKKVEFPWLADTFTPGQ
jgi:hypothetical protein